MADRYNEFGDRIIESPTLGRLNEFGDPIVGTTPANSSQVKNIYDAVMYGMKSSATGLALRGKLPEQQMGADAPWQQRLASNAANVLTDLPLSLVGAVGGGVVGGTAGTAVAGPVGTVGGTLAGGGAGAFGLPMALREALTTAYNHNNAASWEGVWDIAVSALKGGGTGALIGAATGGAGALAGRVAGSTLAPMVGTSITGRTLVRAAETAAVGTELATMTTLSAAVAGHAPTFQDFLDNAVLLAGMKGATSVAKNMRNVYAETGRTPEQQLADAKADPKIKEQLAKGVEPDAYKPLALEERIKAALDVDRRPELIRQAFDKNEGYVKLNPNGPPSPVRWEYVTDVDTARGLLRDMTSMFDAEIQTQRRGVISNEQTAVDALKLVADNKIVEHAIGQGFNAAQVRAHGYLLTSAANEAALQLKKLREIPEADVSLSDKLGAYAAVERLAMLNAEFAGARAEAGRALQIFRDIKRDPSVIPEAQNLLKLVERKGSMQDLARIAEAARDPVQLAKLAEQAVKATGWEKFLEGWKAAILSGPQTHLANVMGNLAKWTVDVPEAAIAASLTALDRAARGDPMKMAQWKARAFAPVLGVQHGARDALTVAMEVARGKGESLEKGDVYRTAIEGKKGEIIRLPFKALAVQDALFRTMAERAQAHIMAVDRAVKEGVHIETREGRELITKYTQEPTLGLSDKAALAVTERIQQSGAEAVFSQRLGPRMETAQRAIAGHWSSMIVPFIRTPTNLVSWAIQHTPGLNLMSGRWRADWAAGGEQRAQATARVLIGTGLALTAYSLAQDDLLTGGGLFDKEMRGTKNASGKQPYSVLINGKYYSYQRIEPVAKVLGLAADLVEMSRASTDEEDKTKLAGMLVLMFGNATVSTTYLSGISNTMNAVVDPDRYGGGLVEQYASSLVPKIIGQPVAMVDPYKREIDGAMDAIQAQLPYFREKLLPKRDVWGQPMKNDRWFDVMPIATSEASKDKVKTEAVRLEVAISDAPKFLTEKGPFNPGDKRVDLTSEQRDVLRAVSGKYAMEILSPIVNSEDWKYIPDFAKVSIYKKVIEQSRERASYEALPPDSAERELVRRKIIDRVMRESAAVNN